MRIYIYSKMPFTPCSALFVSVFFDFPLSLSKDFKKWRYDECSL
ncbi:hypothetical protein VFA_000165 [Vibrio furnissii CIP 102972]|nr:hypothetical protein VFA_000165 [Vibrio furnissii CIP 102972]